MTEITEDVADRKEAVYSMIEQFESTYQYDASYIKELYDRSPEAYSVFEALQPMAAYYRELPPEAHFVVAITVMQYEDCGECLELNFKMARDVGVDESVLTALVNSPESLPPELKDVREHTLLCLGTGSADEAVARRIDEHYGPAAFAELAICIIGTRMYPGLKRTLLKMQACSLNATAQVDLRNAMTSQYFESYNRHLVGLAYRMLGSVEDAEEVAQETFLRYQTAGEPDLENPRAWLTRVCTRICLDRIKSLSNKLEEYPGQWLPEPYVEPMEQASIDETLSMALMVGLQELSSTERAVFLLHDIFDYSFTEVADSLDLSASNCRQLAVRARKKIKGVRSSRQREVGQLERISHVFVQALRDGDPHALQEVLAEDVQIRSDGGGKVPAMSYPLLGRDKVQTFLLRVFLGFGDLEGTRVTITWFNGAPGIIFEAPGYPPSVYQLEVDDSDRIAEIFVQRNPDKLKRLMGEAGGVV